MRPVFAADTLGVPLSILEAPATPTVEWLTLGLWLGGLVLCFVAFWFDIRARSAAIESGVRRLEALAAEPYWLRKVAQASLFGGVTVLLTAAVLAIFVVGGANQDARDAAHDANRVALKKEFPLVVFSDKDIECATDIAQYRDTECEAETVIVGQELQTLKFEKLHGRLIVSLVSEGPSTRLSSAVVLDRTK